jgi:predicted PhzF superfamily epimerase YddE/YHI9
LIKLPIYQIDAFSDFIFGGNPAAVCPLDSWLSDYLMQKLAAENNLSETAFFVQSAPTCYELRWFTPTSEIDLCGHGTLASSHLIFEKLNPSVTEISFETKSGILNASRKADLIELDFPAKLGMSIALPSGFEAAHGCLPYEYLGGSKNIAVFDSEGDVKFFIPNLAYIKGLAGGGLVITAPGDRCDFVSRFFAPKQGIDEDPVTGSAHCTTVPYWAKQLGKNKLHARQISKRGGELYCELVGERVKMAGRAALYMEGYFYLP